MQLPSNSCPCFYSWYPLSFPGGSDGTESTCSAGDQSSILGLGWYPGEGNGYPLHFLPGEIHGQRSLVGYRQWNHKESDMAEWLTLSLSLFTFLHSFLWRSCVCVLSHVWLFVTPWTVTHQAPLSMELPRQEYWNGLPFPPPGDLPDPGVKYTSPASPTLAGRSLPLSHLGSHYGEIIFPIWKLSVVSYGFHVEVYTPWYAHKGLHNLLLFY